MVKYFQRMILSYPFNKSRILEGDCLEVMKSIPDNSIDLICADLPYGITKNHWDIVITPSLLWKQYWRISKPKTPIVLFGEGKFTAMMMLSDPNHRYNIIWKKTNPSGFYNARRMPLRTHEDIMVFYKSLPVYNPQKTKGHPRKISLAKHRRNSKLSSNYGKAVPNSYDSTERFPTSIWEFPADKQKSTLNPTQKPVALIENIIKTYSNEGDIVLDNVSGSGTLGIAALNTNRDFLLIEKDPVEFNKGSNRILDSIHERNLLLPDLFKEELISL